MIGWLWLDRVVRESRCHCRRLPRCTIEHIRVLGGSMMTSDQADFDILVGSVPSVCTGRDLSHGTSFGIAQLD